MLVQAMAQAVGPQLYGAQLTVPLSMHVPAPLQVSCLVSMSPVQDWLSPQAVPLAYSAHAVVPAHKPF